MSCIEYELILPSGEKRYEIVDPDAGTSVMAQVNAFMRMHGAITARPLKNETPPK
jgi:hypothetical protein